MYVICEQGATLQKIRDENAEKRFIAGHGGHSKYVDLYYELAAIINLLKIKSLTLFCTLIICMTMIHI